MLTMLLAGIIGAALGLSVQIFVYKGTPAHSGETILVLSLFLYPLIGILAGAVSGAISIRANWARAIALVVANPATYAVLATIALPGPRSIAGIVWVLSAITTGIAYALTSLGSRRGPAHLCSGCGYNLTGNVSGRCLECGKPVPAQ